MSHCNTLRHTATHCNTLQHTATHCYTLLPEVCALGILHEGERFHVTRWNDFKCHTATHCNTLRHTATHCNTLQHTATHCNTLQHTAIHYYRRSARWESCMRESDLRKCLPAVLTLSLYFAVGSSSLCVAVWCSVLQCVAVCWSVLECVGVC